MPAAGIHPSLSIHLPKQSNQQIKKDKIIKYNFYKANYDIIRNELHNIEWNNIFENVNNVDSMVNIFYEKILNLIDLYVPKKIIKNNKFPEHFSIHSINIYKKK